MNYGPDFTVFFRIWHLVLREKNCSFCVCGVSYYDFADKCVNSVHVIVEMNGFMWCLSGFLCYCAAGLQTVRPGRKRFINCLLYSRNGEVRRDAGFLLQCARIRYAGGLFCCDICL